MPTALYVELMEFTASLQANGAVALRWSTASEREHAYFAVQRSANGSNWSSIDRIAGHGTTGSAHSYASTDEQPLP